jgi:RNA polymerase sigma-70 factor (ECF subfamily)
VSPPALLVTDSLVRYWCLQARSRKTFCEQKFLNKAMSKPVFMIEGRRLVAGDAILSGVEAIERAKEEMLEALVREHSRLVYRIAYAVLRHHHEAEDATQETFMRVLRYNSKLPQIEDPKTWLARIAWRVAVDRSKQLGRTREITLDDPERPMPEPQSDGTSADETVRGAQLQAAVANLIAALPTKLRDPLILSTIEEMSPREVSSTLGINEAAVRSRVFRARQILKEKLAQQARLQGNDDE